MKIKNCQSGLGEQGAGRALSESRKSRRSTLVEEDFDEETAVAEAKRCLGSLACEGCELCRLFCPELCVTRNEITHEIEIDYDFCKGCGICASICPKEAIRMELEGPREAGRLQATA